LIPRLEDLQQGLEYGALECREALREADAAQVHLDEHRTRMGVWVRALESLVDDDESHLRQALADVEAAQARAEDAVSESVAALAFSRTVWAAADRARDHWRAEVDRARRRVAAAHSWVSRATAAVAAARLRVSRAEWELEQARMQVARAEREVSSTRYGVSSAEHELAAAQAALAACLQPVYTTDSEGHTQVVHNDCAGCYARVSGAQSALAWAIAALHEAEEALHRSRLREAEAERELSAAYAELHAAQCDLAHAEAELAEAEEDRRHCETNLAEAERAVELATSAVRWAQAAEATAAEATAAAGAARPQLERAAHLNELQRQRCETLASLVRQADDLVNQGEAQVHEARRHGDTVADDVRCCNNDLSLRVDHLRELDRTYGFV
jgi:chromosome segregation ATPase